ncbi:MAG: ABC transporter ATP-binding protein [Rhodanobacteraceae bacterium]|nr:MAG: ABC transporter ATP-binding protein [Rhodanobacteraceae bacterium]
MSDHPPASLQVDELRVRLGGVEVLRGLSLAVEAGGTLAIIGPSGCGKTTLLRAIAGLLPLSAGRITLGTQRVDALPSQRRGIVYLNQEPLLFPHLNVFENIAFGLRLRHQPDATVRQQVNELLAQLELDGLAQRSPQALSGGQRQRAAFGRALIVAPSLLLLDEPFSNLDPETRISMQQLFKDLAHARGITALFVTHDLKESLRMGDRFAMLLAGQLRHYPDRRAFCADPATGVVREAAFWGDLAGDTAAPAVAPGSRDA